MTKIFYTERDIDELHARGVTSLEVDDHVVLTDLASERAFRVGMKIVRTDVVKASGLDDQEILIQRIKSAVLARLNGKVDPALLDAVVRRVLQGMK